MEVEYIIVQAGGKGTRLKHLTDHKPKAIVPVQNLPMLFHLFRKFPDKKFIIIGDYKKEVLREYLRCFADVKYVMVDAQGKGTCGGLRLALEQLPGMEPFMYIWSDLVLASGFELPSENENYLGISEDFECRWSYKDDQFVEEPSFNDGIAGLFIFIDKSYLSDVPSNGEFVRYLQEKRLTFQRLSLKGTKEYGLISCYKNMAVEKCRPFNRMEIKEGHLFKCGIDDMGRKLAVRERNWYRKAKELGYENIPRLYSYEPLEMELIQGKTIYEYAELQTEQKQSILKKLILNLKALHQLSSMEADVFSVQEAYITKTFARLAQIRDLVPFTDQPRIMINGRDCRNVFFHKQELENQVMGQTVKKFKFIHGDCTFSNMMLDGDGNPVLIDPRGYFGFTENYGDEDYDWAKLYYSIVGNYDRFNLKNFRLTITEDGVGLKIASGGWEKLEPMFFELLPEVSETKIKLLHAVIWLSLTTYAWQDYDSICGAFYNGCYYLEEVLGC